MELELKEGIIAVIVGIDGYKDVKPLRCAVNDAIYFTETLKKVWSTRRVNIKTLIWSSLMEEKAKKQREVWGIELPQNAIGVTRDSILSTVRECADQAHELDTFIFYFSGHGILSNEEPALITVRDGKNAEGVEIIKIREIQEAAADCASQNKVMILDCFQSSTTEDRAIDDYKNLEALTEEWSILLSSSPGEVSLEDYYPAESRDDYLQQGIFTSSLVEGLRGGVAGNGRIVSLVDLAYFVGKRVPIEYKERLKMDMLKRDGSIKGRPIIDKNSQNPVLLMNTMAIDGPFSILMAPEYFPAAYDARRKMPSRQFRKYWYKFLIKPWPIDFPFKFTFQLAGVLYAAAMMFTVLWNSQGAIQTTPVQVFSWIVGLGSAFLWWLTLPFAVASNEDYWHSGGYFTVLFYFLWHSIVVIGFLWIYGLNPPGIHVSMLLSSLVFEMFFLFLGVVLFGCNASQTVIALGETLRTDQRKDIRQAIRVFQQFKYTLIGVDLYDYVAQISLRPDIYFYGWILSIAIVGGSLIQRLTQGVEKGMQIIVVREILVMALVSVLVFWYYAAYKFMQQKVYHG